MYKWIHLQSMLSFGTLAKQQNVLIHSELCMKDQVREYSLNNPSHTFALEHFPSSTVVDANEI